MKISWYIILFIICFGAADIILTAAGMQGLTIASWDTDQISDAWNATKVVEAYDPERNPFYDVGAGLKFLWNLNYPLIDGFTGFLEAYGIDSTIVGQVRVITRATMTLFVISFLSGRDFMP
jgi:hypothetical protein